MEQTNNIIIGEIQLCHNLGITKLVGSIKK
jgi:hypothetical protein